MENAGRRFGCKEVKKMIELQKAEFGWEFLLIGTDIDEVETAARFDINRDRAANYCADSKDTRELYEMLQLPSVQCVQTERFRKTGARQTLQILTLESEESPWIGPH